MRIHYSHHLTSTPGRTSRAEHQSEHASLHTSFMMEYDGGFFPIMSFRYRRGDGEIFRGWHQGPASAVR